jgi:hypothetical protein
MEQELIKLKEENINLLLQNNELIKKINDLKKDFNYPSLAPNGNIIFNGGFSGYNNTQSITKIISNKKCLKTECRISLEIIDDNDSYYECCYCQNCFKEDIMSLWLQENKICPMCRKDWNTNILFINK